MSTETAAPPAKTAPNKPRSAAAWKKLARHDGVTLPSGAIVDIVLPNIQKLIKSGTLPNELLAAALEHQNAKKVTKEMIDETFGYTIWILPRLVVSPEITEEDVPDLPSEDIEMLTNFASRNSDLDAVGHHLAGLETQRSFRELRGILTAEEALRDL